MLWGVLTCCHGNSAAYQNVLRYLLSFLSKWNGRKGLGVSGQDVRLSLSVATMCSTEPISFTFVWSHWFCWVAKKWNHTFTWFSCNLCVSLIPLIKYHYCFADFISFWFCFSSLNHTIVLCWFWVLVPMVTVRFCNSKGQLCLKEAWTFPMCLEIDCTILDKVIIKIFLSSFTFRLSFVPNAGFLLGHKHPLFIPCW